MTPTSKIVTPSLCICGKPNCQIPFGRCHCGCGGRVNLVLFVDYKNDVTFQEARKSIAGHAGIIRPVIEDAVPFKIDGVYCRLIPLTKGEYAIVDAEDYPRLMQWKWIAWLNATNHIHYAVRHKSTGRNKRGIARMHREVLRLEDDDPRFGDHINGLGLDNRRKNLRPATCSQNQMNKKLMKSNRSGMKGVTWNRKNHVWHCEIDVNGRTINLGEHIAYSQACAARIAGEKKYHGEFARSC